MTTQENIEAAEWLEEDARYLKRVAADHAAKGGEWNSHLAQVIAENAEHSESLAAQHRKEAQTS